MPVKKSSSPRAGACAKALDAARGARTNAKPESARKARPRTRPAQQSMDAGARPGNLDEAAHAAERAIQQSQELIAEVHETVQHALAASVVWPNAVGPLLTSAQPRE